MSMFHHDKFDSVETIARTGFLVSLTAYLVFLLADFARPGFVSNYMSVHWWLFAVIIFVFVWSARLEEVRDHPVVQWLVSVMAGIIAAIIVWKIGLKLEEFRILVTLIALILPMVLLGVLRLRD